MICAGARSIGNINGVLNLSPVNCLRKPEEKCTSARWCTGSRGANPDYFVLLTIFPSSSRPHCRLGRPLVKPTPCPGIEPMTSGKNAVGLAAFSETL